MEGYSGLDYSSISGNGSYDIAELMMNQKHILEAIKYLNERIEYKAKNENTNEVNDILESQAMIDQIIVKMQMTFDNQEDKRGKHSCYSTIGK